MCCLKKALGGRWVWLGRSMMCQNVPFWNLGKPFTVCLTSNKKFAKKFGHKRMKMERDWWVATGMYPISKIFENFKWCRSRSGRSSPIEHTGCYHRVISPGPITEFYHRALSLGIMKGKDITSKTFWEQLNPLRRLCFVFMFDAATCPLTC